jgi:tRNA1Val (adenine37-N6)-methyltransferase
VGVEINHDACTIAAMSANVSGLSDRYTQFEGDLKTVREFFKPEEFDFLTCNPPYMTGQHGLRNKDEAKTIARHEVLCTLEDVIRVAAKLLKPGGNFFMVHRPFRLSEIMVLLHQYKLEPKRMQLVYPYVDKEPNMVLIEANRGGKPRLTVEKPLIVYKEPGIYMPEIYDVYGY